MCMKARRGWKLSWKVEATLKDKMKKNKTTGGTKDGDTQKKLEGISAWMKEWTKELSTLGNQEGKVRSPKQLIIYI